MKILFRVDSGHQIGSGHLVRCLSLADTLAESGVECHFVCAELDGHYAALIQQRRYPLSLIPASSWQKDHTVALNYSPHDSALMPIKLQQIDASRTIDAIKGQHFDWVIVDHYQLDRNWEQQIRCITDRVMVIDDLANRDHDCELLLDQNLVADYRSRYLEKVPKNCGCLLGPDFVLLNSDYQGRKKQAQHRKLPVSRILTYFGGADTAEITQKTIKAFRQLNRPEINLDVVIHGNSPKFRDYENGLKDSDNIKFHHSLPSLAPLMLQADLSVGAAGSTSWERCCLGLPSIVVTMASNQVRIAKELHNRGLVAWIGHHDNVTVEDLSIAIAQAVDSSDLTQWSARCTSLIDGRGTKRVASIILINPLVPLRARELLPEDQQLLLDWANDPVVRQQSMRSQLIDSQTHRQWFENQLQDRDDHRCYVIENVFSVPIGLVRFSRTKCEIRPEFCSVGLEVWEVHYLCDSTIRGRGVGTSILKTGLAELIADRNQVCVLGRIKPNNVASRRVFEKLGFEELGAEEKETVWYGRQIDQNSIAEENLK